MSDYPPEITEIVTETGLGTIVGRYRQLFAIEVSFAVGILAMALLFLVIGDGTGRGIGLVFLAVGVLFLIPSIRKARNYLYLCDNGLLIVTRGTVPTALATWREVAHLRTWTTRMYSGEGVQDLSRCILELRDGQKINLAKPPYANGAGIAEYVEECVTEVLLPRRAAKLARTGTAGFGPIKVTKTGVRDGEKFAAWSEITRVERSRVRLRIWTGDRAPTISRQVRTLPDVAVLMTLIVDRLNPRLRPSTGR